MNDLFVEEGKDIGLKGLGFSGLDNRKTGLGLSESAFENTLEIFIKLSVDRVHYKKNSKNLYFVDSLETPISKIITKVLKGFNQTPDIKQCYLDKHSFLKELIVSN